MWPRVSFTRHTDYVYPLLDWIHCPRALSRSTTRSSDPDQGRVKASGIGIRIQDPAWRAPILYTLVYVEGFVKLSVCLVCIILRYPGLGVLANGVVMYNVKNDRETCFVHVSFLLRHSLFYTTHIKDPMA